LAGHLIYAVSDASRHPSHMQPVFAGDLQTGSDVIVNSGGTVSGARVARLSWSRDTAGVYAPITERGTIVVDDVIVSCYAQFSSHSAAHLAMAPLRYFFHVDEFIGRWISSSLFADADLDGIHWYAALLSRVADVLLPKHFWWSTYS